MAEDTVAATETPAEAVQPAKSKQRNIRLKVIPGQMILVEDVVEHSVDTLGITIKHREVTVRKAGTETVKETQLLTKWFSINAVITFSDEYVNA